MKDVHTEEEGGSKQMQTKVDKERKASVVGGHLTHSQCDLS